jgi:hypothetical protein
LCQQINREIGNLSKLEKFMQLKKAMALALFVAAAGGFNGVAYAQSFGDVRLMFTMEQLDKNKDGMVSKQEFMAMMDKAWDMKAKEMKAKDGMMTMPQVNDFFKSLNPAGS